MTYLAEVIKAPQFNSKAIASLFGQRRKDGLWISVQRKEITINNRDVNFKQLILLELDGNFNPLSTVSANSVLFECLRDFSLRLTLFDTQIAGIAESKESLEYQSLELCQRELEMNQREEFQRVKEKKLQKLQELIKQKADAAEYQHVELKADWKRLHYREKQFDNTTKGIKDKPK